MPRGLRRRIVAFLCRRVWRACGRKAVFINHVGHGFKCNPKYAAMALKARRPDLDVVWMGGMTRDDLKRLPKGIRYRSLHGLGALRELATAGAWVDNTSLLRFVERGLVKKPGQLYVQTWHGSMGPKKMDAEGAERGEDDLRELAMVDCTVSNSRFETEIYGGYYPAGARALEFGHPRNDVFFGEAAKRLPGEVRSRLGLAPGSRLCLYAPTFRDTSRRWDAVGARALLDALEARFGGEWTLLFRPHPKDKGARIVDASGTDPSRVRDVSAYDDMQELMVAADAMVTDYSGCIYDYVLSRRPGFLYAPDIRLFSEERGLYYPLSETPFPLAETAAELVSNIRSFDSAAYAAAVGRFLEARGSVEDGGASERLAAFVEKALEERSCRSGS